MSTCIIFTNAFLWQRYISRAKIEFNDFMREIAVGLMHNDFLATEHMRQGDESGAARSSGRGSTSSSFATDYLEKSPRSRAKTVGTGERCEPCQHGLNAGTPEGSDLSRYCLKSRGTHSSDV